MSVERSHEVLTADQISAWRERGYCVVEVQHTADGDRGWVLTANDALRFREAARTAVLGNGTDVSAIPDLRNFGGLGFPFFGRRSEPLNDLALHPRILAATKQLLNLSAKEHVLLSQAECWVKRDNANGSQPSNVPPEYVNTDQRMHCDFPNHYLTVPPPWYEPEAVAMIVYLDDSGECGGETACVSRDGPDDEVYQYPPVQMPGFGEIPWINDRTLAEGYLKTHHPAVYRFRQELYKRERKVEYRVGTILFYRLDLWHRGTPLNTSKDRAVVNLLYKKSTASHVTSWHRGWAQNAYNAWGTPRIYPPQVGSFESLLMRLTSEQRTSLGFPPPGHPFWTQQTISALQLRYPQMDMSAYKPSKL